ncbi:hypothetical protein Tco_0158111 [Tanacetum coccineum]
MIMTTNTPYPSRKIQHIRDCTHQIPQRKEDQYAVSREDQYAILDIWRVNILEDIKCGPYSKKLQYAISNPLDTPYGVSVPALTKDHKGNKFNTPYPVKTNTPYWRYSI